MAPVIISDSALRRIRKIHSYYCKKASLKIAEKIVHEIFSQIRYLETHPEAWQEEDYLKKMRKGHRRIISGNYKIIYRFKGELILVTDVFDSRRSTRKMNG